MESILLKLTFILAETAFEIQQFLCIKKKKMGNQIWHIIFFFFRVLLHFSHENLDSQVAEFQQYHLVFLGLAFAMLIVAPIVSKWVPFYYSAAIAFGMIAVILFLLDQSMEFLPCGTNNTLYNIICGSVVGLGYVILNYSSWLLHSALWYLGFDGDLFNRSTNDTLLAMLMLIVGVILTSALTYMLASFFHSRQRGQLLRNKQDNPRSQFLYRLPTKDADVLECQGTAWNCHQYNPHIADPSLASPMGTRSPISYISGLSSAASTRDYYSTFHETSERKHFSKKEWNVFTKSSTMKALKQLFYTPEFAEWALAHAETIMINPQKM